MMNHNTEGVTINIRGKKKEKKKKRKENETHDYCLMSRRLMYNVNERGKEKVF